MVLKKFVTKSRKEKKNKTLIFFTTCCDKNTINDSWFKRYIYIYNLKFYMMMWHVILNWDFIYPCHNFKIKNYLMQYVTI